ncbi:hypothetical protein ACFX5Q_26580 [Mesorhizobium sp. IMUNJ 23033]
MLDQLAIRPIASARPGRPAPDGSATSNAFARIRDTFGIGR